MHTEKRKLITLEIVPLLLTAVIAISACFSTYFTYQTAKIASDQKDREQRKEFIEWITLIKEVAETVHKLDQDFKSQSVQDSNKSVETNQKPGAAF